MLSEPKLDFKKAFELAQAMEAAERNVRDLQSATTQEKLHALHLQSQDAAMTRRTPPSRCYRCGANHKAADCRFKDTECHYCHKKGHIAKVCQSKTRDFNRKPPCSPPPRKGSTHHVVPQARGQLQSLVGNSHSERGGNSDGSGHWRYTVHYQQVYL